MKALYLLASGLFLAAVSCERHDWEETKILHETHDSHEKEHDEEAHDHDHDHKGHDH